MEYLYLFLACVLFSVQYIFYKIYQDKSGGTITACLISSTVSSFFGFAYCMLHATITGGDIFFNLTKPVLVYSLIYALAGIVCGVVFMFALNYGNLSVLTTYSLLGGMVLPFLYGVLFNNESATLFKCIGTVLLVVSLFPTAIERLKTSKVNKQGKSIIFIIFCFLVFIGNGMTSVISKVHQLSPQAISSNGFVMIGSLERAIISAIILIIYCFVVRNKAKFQNNNRFSFKMIIFLAFMLLCYAIIHSLGDIFSLICANTMDASIQFSFISAFVIFGTAIIGKFLFKEEINKAQRISLSFTVAGILCLLVASLANI